MAIEIAILLFAAWIVQAGLSALQIHRYYGRIAKLRRLGRCATGMSGGRYRGRTYAVVVVNPTTRVVTHAEKLSGMTVFATLRPIPELVGAALDDLVSRRGAIEGLKPRLAEAVQIAAQTIQQSIDAPASSNVPAEAAESSPPGVNPTNLSFTRQPISAPKATSSRQARPVTRSSSGGRVTPRASAS